MFPDNTSPLFPKTAQLLAERHPEIAHKIDQDCQLIEVARAARAHAITHRCLIRENEREPLRPHHPAIDAERRDRIKMNKAIRVARGLRISDDDISEFRLAGTREGMDDARRMSPAEVTAYVRMFDD